MTTISSAWRGGYFLSTQFGADLPSTAVVTSVTVRFEHFEEVDITPNALTLEAGGGTIQAPTVALSITPVMFLGSEGEGTLDWDLTSEIDTPAEVNALTFVVRNNATNGKKSYVDHIQLSVTYTVGGTITAPTAIALGNPQVRIEPGAERTDGLDVSAFIDTSQLANGLIVTVRNNAANGKKSLIDRAYVEFTYTAAPAIATTPSTSAFTGNAYSYAAAVTGTPPITWSLPTRPAWLTVSAAGVVSGTAPTSVGSHNVTLRAANSAGTAEQSWTIDVSVAPPSVTLFAAGDVAGCNTTRDSQTAAVLAANPVGDVILMGDGAYESGLAIEYANCYGPTWGAHKDRTHPVPGNHEYAAGAANPNARDHFEYFGAAAGPTDNAASRGYYSFDYGDWHIIGLNSEQDIGATGTQLDWLRADLEATSKTCVLAFWHRPRFASGNYTDNAALRPFWDALRAADAEIVLNGHDHNYQRFRLQDAAGNADPGGIREFIVGTGGQANYALRTDARREAAQTNVFGVLKLTLSANSYDRQFLPIAGQNYSDSGTGTCN